MRRLSDLILSSVGLIVLSVPIAIIAFLLWRSGISPVLFRQTRPGRDGKLFEICKFRTMTDEVDEHGELLSDEERLTRLGALLRRTSLDELPSLWNVLRGDMAIVGPRPLLPEYLPLYSKTQARRHEVRPGVTGWAQVNGRNSLSWQDKFALDVWYVDNRSLALDYKIIWLTIRTVLGRSGVSSEGYATMPDFLGNPPDYDDSPTNTKEN